jgi:Pyruvate/2-oxoacid:ferredoxin oxidoreductase delta subunit
LLCRTVVATRSVAGAYKMLLDAFNSLFWGRKTESGYQPSKLHQWLSPNITGNEHNGLGETEKRRPKPIYHQVDLRTPFQWIQDIFYWRLRLHPGFAKQGITADLYRMRRFAKKAPHKQVDTAENWSEKLKQFALASGADVVGITPLVADDHLYEDYKELDAPWLIMFGRAMDHDVQKNMGDASTWRRSKAGSDTLAHYNAGTNLVFTVANWIREQGYEASGSSGPYASPVNMVRAALDAGLGELGKHGSLINREIGANMRLSYVLTDLPLIADQQDEFGVDDFCSRCRVCEKGCPADAFAQEKQMVRGVERWYVDFDKCLPYFNDNFGCGICVNICPWSTPNQQEKLIFKMARWKQKQQDKAQALEL